MSVSSPPPQLPQYSWADISPSAHLLYIRSALDADRETALLSTGVLGFDLEWKPVFRKGQPDNPVALVQLANTQRILLIQISRMLDFPARLKQLLEDPSILKVGAGIQKDAQKLFRDCNVSMRGCVDLSLLARTVDNAQWKGPYRQAIGLARLVQTYKSLAMDKGKVQRSNWERMLTPAQQTYAGNDAHAGFTIYTALEEMMKEMTIMPRTEYYTFDCVGGFLCTPSGAAWFPYNPDYDPGPPPPPPPPRMKQEQKDKQSGDAGLPPSPQMAKGKQKENQSEDAGPPPSPQMAKGKQKEKRSRDAGQPPSPQIANMKQGENRSRDAWPSSPPHIPQLQPPPRTVEGQKEEQSSDRGPLPPLRIKDEQQPRIANPQSIQSHCIRPRVLPTTSHSAGGTIHRNEYQTARPAFRKPWRPRRPPHEQSGQNQGQNQGPTQFNARDQHPHQNMTTDRAS